MTQTRSPITEPGSRLLKRDLFGEVRLESAETGLVSRRDTTRARWWTRAVARWLAAREARALQAAAGIEGIPRVIDWDGHVLDREWLDGEPMQVGKPTDTAYYAEALHLVRRLHRAGVVHNDTAKEPNWLVRPDGRPALIDFQVALVSHRRGPLFRLLGREDLRHLLKHKRSYAPQALTARQRRILATPAWTSRWWHASGKRVYLWFTRRVLGWADREGAGDRQG
ncbi:MAG: serine/threonine protein kinase [Gammaproteobacteria bacterium]|nr:serine/threonine protein kinase [Gammaproteobacteria bacterium]